MVKVQPICTCKRILFKRNKDKKALIGLADSLRTIIFWDLILTQFEINFVSIADMKNAVIV